MKVEEVLRLVDLGSSVAESDAALERYFVETRAFDDLVNDRGDVIAGDKGTGKTALYRILRGRYRSIPALSKVEVLAAFNPAGNPIFQRLAEVGELEEGQYISFWKTYVFALVSNWVLDIYVDAYTEDMKTLEALLNRTGLNSADVAPETVFGQMINRLKRVAIKKAELAVTLGPQGIPVVVPRLEFDEVAAKKEDAEAIRYEEALGLLQRILDSEGIVVWLVMDRLDEAFQGFPGIEIPALRALLRTYLDLGAYPHLRLKLFIRSDLFRKIAEGGFVNLTHISARKIDIEWDDNNLYALLCGRLRENTEFVKALGTGPEYDALFKATFPDQVDEGQNRPTTWNWMLTRIQDGNGTRPPRNLIDLVRRALDAQLRKEERTPREHDGVQSLIQGESLKRGLEKMSTLRVQDTLLAESGADAKHIERFRNGKAEHNAESLQALLGVPPEDLPTVVQRLREAGFFESGGETFRVPFLYRDGLGITQGKAF